jgi:hypothetical protein
MSHFVEFTVFTAGREGSQLDPERHVPTLFNTDHIRWVRAAQDGEKSFLQIGDESGASASYVTVDEDYLKVAHVILTAMSNY